MSTSLTPSDRSAPADTIRVLLVDDQRIVAAGVARLLGPEPDMVLQCCARGADALAHAAEFRPSVILQDLVMPDMDGLALVGMYRAAPVTSGTPVIVLSAHDDPAVRDQALAAGAVEYLVKLPSQHHLVACIRHHAHASKPGPAPLRVATDPDAEVVDGRVLATLREVDATAEFLSTVMELFLTEAQGHASALRAAADAADGARLRTVAHALKGCAMTVGARRVAQACEAIEAAPQPPDPPFVAALLARIDVEIERVRDAFRQERTRTAR